MKSIITEDHVEEATPQILKDDLGVEFVYKNLESFTTILEREKVGESGKKPGKNFGENN